MGIVPRCCLISEQGTLKVALLDVDHTEPREGTKVSRFKLQHPELELDGAFMTWIQNVPDSEIVSCK